MLPAFLLAETALSFLGVGLQEPEPSWGNMLAEATNLTLLRRSPFTLLSPALAIILVTLAAHLIADALKKRRGGANSVAIASTYTGVRSFCKKCSPTLLNRNPGDLGHLRDRSSAPKVRHIVARRTAPGML
ncbi:MAG: hypothetical protein WKF84_30435 [Pyrinomonadaceae bacterium]